MNILESTKSRLSAAGLQLPVRAGTDGQILDNEGRCLIVVDQHRELPDEDVVAIVAILVTGLNSHAASPGEAAVLEARLRDPDYQPEGDLPALVTCAAMFETYGPDALPASDRGQVSFARCMMDAAAAEIRAFVNNTASDLYIRDAQLLGDDAMREPGQ